MSFISHPHPNEQKDEKLRLLRFWLRSLWPWLGKRLERFRPMPDVAEKIPSWAPLVLILGALISIICFLAAWFTVSGFATLGLTAGLILMAISMNAAEKAINANPKE